jgi:hypothetical protein
MVCGLPVPAVLSEGIRVVDSTICPKCSSPVPSGEAFCANCGAPLPGAAEREARPVVPGARERTGRGSGPKSPKVLDGPAVVGAGETTPARASTEAADRQAPVPAPPPSGLPPAARADPRLAALGLGLDDPASSVTSGDPGSHDPIAPPVHMPGTWELDLGSLARETSAPPAPDPEPADAAAGHVPGGYLPPSATYRGSGWTPPERGPAGPGSQSTGPGMGASIGAVPVTAAGIGSPLEPAPGTPWPAPAPIAPPGSEPVTPPIRQSRESPSAGAPAATPDATISTRKETVQELVAFGLVAAGGVVGFASFFLPWAGSTGIGIGTVAMAGSSPQPNQWAWGMPAAIPLFLLTGLILGAAAGSDRAQQRLPELAPAIARVTDVMLPMLLSGLYFGVGVLYVTLPYGFGTGIFVLIAGACLLLAGSIVALFLPPKQDSIAG